MRTIKIVDIDSYSSSRLNDGSQFSYEALTRAYRRRGFCCFPPQCRKTRVTGITAAQALTKNSVTDFLILERNDYVGGPRAVRPVRREAGRQDTASPPTSATSSTLSSRAPARRERAGHVDARGLQHGGVEAPRRHARAGRRVVKLGFRDGVAARAERVRLRRRRLQPHVLRWSGENHFVTEQRGFSTFIEGEAARACCSAPSCATSRTGPGGDCVEACFAVCTFSQFQMGTYTKIFMRLDEEAFWDPSTEFFLYAEARDRGYYPVFQPLAAPGFLGEDSSILFVTVVGDRSYRVEQQPHEVARAEVMAVARGNDVGKHQNLRANVSRLHFAGEGSSAQYLGFLQGAWFEGRDAGLRNAAGLLRQRRRRLASVSASAAAQQLTRRRR
ncbi:hypothetical protein DL769_003969 [Monosporascus sp. CRB-8-3]|nr:hypothetical protein DL769_003969 [Monosporascus sp. CRB-8-3]